MKTDRDFFQRFPISAVIGVVIGISLLVLSIDFVEQIKFLSEYVFVVKFLKNTSGIIILSYYSFRILLYFLRFSSSKKFEKNLFEIRDNFLNNVTKDGSTLIADFISFRPWMNDEFHVKAKKGIPNIFVPTYLVAFAIKDNVLYITEVKAYIQNKTYSITGYHIIPTKFISCLSLYQERILFSSKAGDASATNYFIEIGTSSERTKIALFEEEILSKYGDISQMKEEFIYKIMVLTKTLNRT